MLLAQIPLAFHWRTLRASGEEEEIGGIEKQPETRGSGESAKGGDTKWAEGG